MAREKNMMMNFLYPLFEVTKKHLYYRGCKTDPASTHKVKGSKEHSSVYI